VSSTEFYYLQAEDLPTGGDATAGFRSQAGVGRFWDEGDRQGSRRHCGERRQEWSKQTAMGLAPYANTASRIMARNGVVHARECRLAQIVSASKGSESREPGLDPPCPVPATQLEAVSSPAVRITRARRQAGWHVVRGEGSVVHAEEVVRQEAVRTAMADATAG